MPSFPLRCALVALTTVSTVLGGASAALAGTTTAYATAAYVTTADAPLKSPIQQHYEELGGASSFLGQPTGPELPVAAGRARTYQGGNIYWSSPTGAYEVHGRILDRYRSAGGPGSFLGFPLADEFGVPNGRGSNFQGGSVYWSAATDAHEAHGAILSRYLALGGAGSPVGFPTTDEVAAGAGRATYFQGAAIFWSAGTGTQQVHGAILGKYLSLGGAGSFLGLPTSEEFAVPAGGANRFQGGMVFWSAATTAHEVRGAILARYLSVGGSGSSLGLPVSDEFAVSGGRQSNFQRGSIRWDAATGVASVNGSTSGAASTAVSWAYQQLNKPYVYGAAGPNSFDCSGLTQYVWGKAGVALPHSSASQYSYGRHVTQSELRPGDLVFFYSPISHVSIYVGDGYIIDAPHSGATVRKILLSDMPSYAGAVRLAG